MRINRSYHTAIKICFILGVEQILPEELRKSIPRSTIYDWRREKESKYVGHEFASKVSKNIGQANIFLDDRVKYERELFVAFSKIKFTIINLIGKTSFKKLLQENKPKVVEMIEKVKPIFNTSTLCKFLNIEDKTYSVWKVKTALFCPASKINLCLRQVSHQITNKEIASLKKFMTDPQYFHWPTGSVWALAVRSKEVVMARSTWYKYVGNFDLKRTKVSKKQKPKMKPLRAASKNEIWHADVSVFTTVDNVKYYIYTVVDNFSRMILAWDIDTTLSASIRLRSIERAIKDQFDVELSGQSVDLIVDGGSENNNHTIHDFIQNNRVNINKKIALKDIIQSNSMIEATYKIMKYRYFYSREILSSAMRAAMEFFVHDYNEVRPHNHHLYKTPYEVHYDIDPIDYKKIINQAIKDRVVFNRQQTCDLNCQRVKN